MMENMIISSRKSKKIQMVMMMCKKHPKHRQSPGVCSICLRKKLTKLLPSTSSSRATTVTNASTCSSSSSLSSLSSECSSNASSNNSSPMHHQHSYRGQRRPRRQEVGLEGKAGHLLSFLKMMRIKNDNKINVLTKSRSMAFVEERERRISMDGIVKENNKKGFWSKLIRSKSSNKRRMKAEGGLLMHSKTMRDMLTTR